ncbi:hypothetical protein ACU686_18435 [Yinghuangia aomiensis]
MDSGTAVMYTALTFSGRGVLYALVEAPVRAGPPQPGGRRVPRLRRARRLGAVGIGRTPVGPTACRPRGDAPSAQEEPRAGLAARSARPPRLDGSWPSATPMSMGGRLGAHHQVDVHALRRRALRGGPHPDLARLKAEPAWWLTSGVLCCSATRAADPARTSTPAPRTSSPGRKRSNRAVFSVAQWLTSVPVTYGSSTDPAASAGARRTRPNRAARSCSGMATT